MPPEVTHHLIDLPLTRLHYVKCGEGPPLIMVPATISAIDNWLSLIQFMGQSFTAHFFELPGHGKSTAFEQKYTSELVAQSVEHLIDALGFETINIMGSSFGGVLTMKTVYHLQHRLERVILLSPVTAHHALSFSRPHKMALLTMMRFFSIPSVNRIFIKVIHNDWLGKYFTAFIRRFGQVEESVPLEEKLKDIKGSTIQVLTHQLVEILTLEYSPPPIKFKHPCFFAMSVLDPLLSFDTTLNIVREQFEQVNVERFYFPYHQPKVMPTFDELNWDFGKFIDMIE
jgi:pimeloyl-ACP methyl ester carboxylesterase